MYHEIPCSLGRNATDRDRKGLCTSLNRHWSSARELSFISPKVAMAEPKNVQNHSKRAQVYTKLFKISSKRSKSRWKFEKFSSTGEEGNDIEFSGAFSSASEITRCGAQSGIVFSTIFPPVDQQLSCENVLTRKH